MAAQKALMDTVTRSGRAKTIGDARPSLRTAPLDEAARGQIYRQWRRGVSIEVLAQQSGRSPAMINRAINEGRAQRILEQKLEVMYDPSFDAPGAAETILAPMPRGGQGEHRAAGQASGRPSSLPG